MRARLDDARRYARQANRDTGQPHAVGLSQDGRQMVAPILDADSNGPRGLYGRDWLAAVLEPDGWTEASEHDVAGVTWTPATAPGPTALERAEIEAEMDRRQARADAILGRP